MALQDILSSIKSFVSSSTKTQSEFKNESTKNNRNISSAIRDISKMFASQRSMNEKQSSSLADILDITQSTYSTTQQNNNLLQQSISLQNQMLKELKDINSGVGSLIKTTEEGNQNSSGGFASAAIKTAAGMLGLGAIAAPGILNNFFGDQTGAGIFSNSAGGGGSGAGSSENASKAMEFFKSKGWTEEQAAAIVGNLQAESGKNLDPSALGDNGAAFGIAQWQGPRQEEFRKKFGKDIRSSTLVEQLEFIQHELETTYKDAADKIRSARTVAEAAAIVDKHYEQSAGWHTDRRIANANALLERDGPTVEAGVKPGEEYNPSRERAIPQSSATGIGSVEERQAELAGIRKQPISDQLRYVLQQAANAAGVKAVIYSGGQPSKDSGGGPRTGSTRHDNGNAADLWLEKDGRKLSDTNPEDKAVMQKFVSAAVQAGATGVGAGHDYMGPSNIHVGFGRPATWGGADWISGAGSGVYSNRDLSGTGGGGVFDSIASSALGALSSVFDVFGMGNMNIPNLLSSFFGIPFMGAEMKENKDGTSSFGSMTEEEAEEGQDMFMGRSRGQGGPTAEEINNYKKENDFINYEQQGSLADQIREVSMLTSTPIVMQNNQMMGQRTEPEAMTDFGATGNQPRNTRASWAPTIAVLRPEPRMGEKIRWAARISSSTIV